MTGWREREDLVLGLVGDFARRSVRLGSSRQSRASLRHSLGVVPRRVSAGS